MAELTVANVFDNLAELFNSKTFQAVLPIVTSALAAVEANPATVKSPVSAVLFGAQLIADLLQAAPTSDNTAIQSATKLIQAIVSTIEVVEGNSVAITAPQVTITGQVSSEGAQAASL